MFQKKHRVYELLSNECSSLNQSDGSDLRSAFGRQNSLFGIRWRLSAEADSGKFVIS